MTARDGSARAPDRLTRFAAAYRGGLAPADALFWAEHPLDDAPSGQHSPFAAQETRRRGLYARGADPGDAARVAADGARLDGERALMAEALAVADAGGDTASAHGVGDAADAAPAARGSDDDRATAHAGAHAAPVLPADRGRARTSPRLPSAARIAVGAGAVAIAAAAVLAVQAVRDELPVSPPSGSPDAPGIPAALTALDPRPIPAVGDSIERARQEADVPRLADGPAAGALGRYFQEHPERRPGTLANIRDSYAVDLDASATRLVDLGPGGELSLFVICSAPAPYWLSVEIRTGPGPDADVLQVRGHGRDCSRLAYSSLGLGEGWSVDRISVDMLTAGVHYLLDAELAP